MTERCNLCGAHEESILHQDYRAVACDVTSAAFNQNVWQNVRYLYRERRVFNFSVVVERVTTKPLWHDNRLSVGTNILEG